MNVLDSSADVIDDAAHLLDQGLPLAARDVLRAAVATGDSRPATMLSLAIAEDRCGEVDVARRRILTIEQACPEWDEPPLRLAELYRRSGDVAAAETAYRRVLALNPLRSEALVALGAGLTARGRPIEALPLLKRACDHASPSFEAWHAFGVALLATGNAVAAEAALAEACRQAPERLDMALHRADAVLEAGRAEDELSRLEQAAELSPLNPLPLRVRAYLLERLGRLTESADLLQAAAEIAPADAGCAAALGSALARLGRESEAEPALRRALLLDPGHQQARADLAAVLIERLCFLESESLLRALLAERGDDAVLMANLATALLGQGRQTEAAVVARRATDLAPESSQPWRTLVGVLPYIEKAEAHAAAARASAGRCIRRAREPFLNDRHPERPLRIGLLSGALRTHPVGWLTLAGFEALDPASFDIICLGPHAAGNVFARRFAARASAWHDTGGGDDVAVAELCRKLKLDLIVDLGGQGAGGRLGVLANRAAPVQIKWVGSQVGTTGLPEMDWLVTDRWETPPEYADLYTERLLRLPDGYVCYETPSYAPDVTPPPALRAGHVTFGCFNNLAKVTPDVIQTWATIMSAVPGSRLLLKAPQLSDPRLASQVSGRFAAAGMDLDRIMLRGTSMHRAHLAAYEEIDVALDPFPYSGGLSTCEALWMGVPTITLPGRSFASRHTLSHQENAGLSGWAAGSLKEYVALAIDRAADLQGLAALRSKLRAQVAASPLCDAPRFGQALGAAFRHAWQAWCREPDSVA